MAWNRLRLFRRYVLLVSRKPLVETLKRGVECPGFVEVARATKVLVEVALELEHVAELVGTRKSETAIYLRRHASPSNTAPVPKGGWLSTPNGLALQLHLHGHLSERLLLAAFQVFSTIASTNLDTSGAITKITIKTIGQANKNPFIQ